jgi:hypothetical protein
MGQAHQILAYAEDMNRLGDNIDTLNKNIRNLIDASKGGFVRNKCRLNYIYVAVSSPERRPKWGHKK